MKINSFLMTSLLVIMLMSCASVSEEPNEEAVDYSGEPVFIQVKNPGISPNNDGLFDSVDFLVLAGNNYTPERWVVNIVVENGNSIRKLSGTGPAPSKLSWNGRTDTGVLAENGRYFARIAIWFPGAITPIIQETAVFVLDSIGPVGNIKFSEGLFSPDEDGINDNLIINIEVTDELSEIASWTLSIYDSHEAEIKRFYSDQQPGGLIEWNGMQDERLIVNSASDYTAVLYSRDSLGNTAYTVNNFSTDILVIRQDDQLQIRINSINFKGYSADFMDVDAEQRQSNIDVLDLIASKLKKFPGYKITLEGHAVSIFWGNPVKAEKENNEVLIPLSEARAESIRDALKERGVNVDSMNVKGLGATRPIVPFSDLQNRWTVGKIAV